MYANKYDIDILEQKIQALSAEIEDIKRRLRVLETQPARR